VSTTSSLNPASASVADSLTDIRNFVPRQVCVAVKVNAILNPELNENDALYDPVLQILNSNITALERIGAPTATPASDVVDDHGKWWLNPSNLRNFEPAAAPTPVPWLTHQADGVVRIPPPTKTAENATVLLYYAAGFASLPADGNDDLVRRLVNAINLLYETGLHPTLANLNPSFASVNLVSPPPGVTIESAMPNWYTVVADDCSCGGPSGQPWPFPAAPPASLRFDSASPAVKQALGRHGDAAPIVYVLDTCPDDSGNDPTRNAGFLGSAKEFIGVNGAAARFSDLSLHPDDYPSNTGSPVLPNWYGPQRDWSNPNISAQDKENEFNVSDHGLFVTGIVRQVCPSADIRLVRTLGRYGVGDTAGLTAILRKVLLEVQTLSQPIPILINASLMVDYPTDLRSAKRWFPSLPESLAVDGTYIEENDNQYIGPALNAIHQPLRATIDAVVAKNILIVAAAGNDMLPNVPRPAPRFPAGYPNVLSVAALTGSGHGAEYSNRAATFPTASVTGGNGVAVLGGACRFSPDSLGPIEMPPVNPAVGILNSNAALGATTAVYGPRTVTPGASEPDGVIGLFTANYMPLSNYRDPYLPAPGDATADGIQNTTGWAYWSGTSFAAPIITGLAANLWSVDPSQPPFISTAAAPSVKSLVQALAGTNLNLDLNCGLILIDQTH
jgi:hypothetical protein